MLQLQFCNAPSCKSLFLNNLSSSNFQSNLAFQQFLKVVRKLVDAVPESEVKNATFAKTDGIKSEVML